MNTDEHVIDWTREPGEDKDYKFTCSCGAHWSLGPGASEKSIAEIKRSHLISVGLKPSEIL